MMSPPSTTRMRLVFLLRWHHAEQVAAPPASFRDWGEGRSGAIWEVVLRSRALATCSAVGLPRLSSIQLVLVWRGGCGLEIPRRITIIVMVGVGEKMSVACTARTCAAIAAVGCCVMRTTLRTVCACGCIGSSCSCLACRGLALRDALATCGCTARWRPLSCQAAAPAQCMVGGWVRRGQPG